MDGWIIPESIVASQKKSQSQFKSMVIIGYPKRDYIGLVLSSVAYKAIHVQRVCPGVTCWRQKLTKARKASDRLEIMRLNSEMRLRQVPQIPERTEILEFHKGTEGKSHR